MERKSILLVDDERVILKSLGKELANEDLEVTLAASGEEAVAKIENGNFDLVITDLIMRGLDGFQVLKAAKKKNTQTMVIILTGYADLKACTDALRLGADDFLEKPCEVDELIFRISNCIIKQDLLRKVEIYENFLPVCSYCKKIRDDHSEEQGNGNWYNLEDYLIKVKGVYASHGICPACLAQELKKISKD